MNTQLKDHHTTGTVDGTHFSRPQPVWCETNALEGMELSPGRKSGWLAVVAAMTLLAVAIVALTAIGSNPTNSGEPVVPEVARVVTDEPPVFDSPGGNSLNTSPRVQSAAFSAARGLFDSPGGNSLNIPQRVQRPAVSAAIQDR